MLENGIGEPPSSTVRSTSTARAVDSSSDGPMPLTKRLRDIGPGAVGATVTVQGVQTSGAVSSSRDVAQTVNPSEPFRRSVVVHVYDVRPSTVGEIVNVSPTWTVSGGRRTSASPGRVHETSSVALGAAAATRAGTNVDASKRPVSRPAVALRIDPPGRRLDW